ncbi:MAG: hypothetical protein LBB62_05670, partial [Proteiniphilum sp.]|nr:hypothetical protein [Proteiniphilum sp.]
MRLLLYILYKFLLKNRKCFFPVLLLFCFAQTRAQLAPGGINPADAPLRLWLRADALGISPANGGNVTLWTDISQRSKAIYRSSSSQSSGIVYQQAPKYKANSFEMNFYPAVNFDRVAGSSGYQQYLSTSTRIMTQKSPDNFTVFVVANVSFEKVANTGSSSNPEQIAYFMGFGGDYIYGSNSDSNVGRTGERAPAFGMTGGRRSNAVSGNGGKGRFYSYNTGDNFDGTQELFTAGSTTIAVHQVKKKEYIQYEADGRTERVDRNNGLTNAQANNIMSQTGITMNGKSMVGTGSRPARNMIGDIAEIIVYEGILSAADKDKVYTYLAMKYGITLDVSNSISYIQGFDYKFSGGSTFWMGKASQQYRNYHRNVASIFTDKASAVINTKSRSTGDDNFITIGLRNPSQQLPDQAAIVWGHNGGSASAKVVSADKCAPYKYNFDRIWMLDRSLTLDKDNTKRELMLKASTLYSDTYPFEGKGWDTYLLIAKNETDAKNKNWDLAIPAALQYDAVNGIWEQVFNFELDQDVNRLFFSIGGTENESACAACTFTGEDKLLITKSNASWKVSIPAKQTTPVTLSNILSAKRQISMGVEFKADNEVTLKIDAPAVHSANSPVHLRASGSANAKSSIKYTFNQPSNVEFTIGDIDNSEYVNVYGYCEVGGSMIRPRAVVQYPLKGSDLRRGYTYTITNGSHMSGNGKESTGRGNPRGKVSIGFGKAVKVVVIEYSSTKSGARWLDLYPLSFSCPPELPPPNEAGYAFQKRGPQALDICETVDYSFTVLNANVDCGREPVHFTDYLPKGMFWVPSSLVIDGEDLDAGKPIVMQDRILDLSLLVRGSGNKTTLRAQAAFTDEAVAGTYYN